MKESQARALTTRLIAAFPSRRVEAATAALYIETLMPYDAPVGMKAVQRLIDQETYLPAVSVLRLELREARKEAQPERLALEAGEWTEEDEAKARDVGRRLLREYLNRSPGAA